MITNKNSQNEFISRLKKQLDFDISINMGFIFSREHFNELFAEKQEDAGKVARDLTDMECQDLLADLYDYIEDQLYDMYSAILEKEGCVDEFINERLP